MTDSEIILAHWQYEREEWEHFIDSEWARVGPQIKRPYTYMAVTLLLFLVLVGVAALFRPVGRPRWLVFSGSEYSVLPSSEEHFYTATEASVTGSGR